MAIVSFQLEEQQKEALAALAASHGGTSALLRQLVAAVLQQQSQEPPLPEPKGHLVALKTRLSVTEVKAVKGAAAARGMKVGQWLRSLIRVRLGAGPQWDNHEIIAMRNLTAEVARIGVNLNQLVKAVNRAQKLGESHPINRQTVDEARAVLEKVRKELLSVARGNLRYWEPEE